ncbi:MAG: FAD-dependent oxidoreductase [Anaerolineales bacterium]|jgi:glycerol-3-phosphate dehydrogenase
MEAFRIAVIGAGSTGAAVAHDLALRGFAVTVLERGEVASGTTGRNHGLLHSGARYCMTDPEAAEECAQENLLLRKIAPGTMELNDGLFVALNEEDLAYKDRFQSGCEAAGIPAQWLTKQEVLYLEPQIHPDNLGGFRVQDGVFEPMRFCLSFLASAKANGAKVLAFAEVEDLVLQGKAVQGVRIHDRLSGKRQTLGVDLVVNAAGPWAGEIAAMAGLQVPVVLAPGVMISMQGRFTEMVVNRLNMPGDGDIVIPQRETSILGTTLWTVDQADTIPIPEDHVRLLLDHGQQLVPAIRESKPRGIFAVARPLVGAADSDERSLSRTFRCIDHAAQGVEGLVTIVGGKTTTARAMAEKTADVVCAKMGVARRCRTHQTQLASYRDYYRM